MKRKGEVGEISNNLNNIMYSFLLKTKATFADENN
jgi:hypothetical protein